MLSSVLGYYIQKLWYITIKTNQCKDTIFQDLRIKQKVQNSASITHQSTATQWTVLLHEVLLSRKLWCVDRVYWSINKRHWIMQRPKTELIRLSCGLRSSQCRDQGLSTSDTIRLISHAQTQILTENITYVSTTTLLFKALSHVA